MDRNVSLLDYIFAIDTMPVSDKPLAKLIASDNTVISRASPTCEKYSVLPVALPGVFCLCGLEPTGCDPARVTVLGR